MQVPIEKCNNFVTIFAYFTLFIRQLAPLEANLYENYRQPMHIANTKQPLASSGRQANCPACRPLPPAP